MKAFINHLDSIYLKREDEDPDIKKMSNDINIEDKKKQYENILIELLNNYNDNVLVHLTEDQKKQALDISKLMPFEPTEKKEFVMGKARESLPGLRRQIGNNLKLRRVPEIRLEYDNRAEALERVEKVLNEEVKTKELSHSRLKSILNKLAWWRR